MEWYAKLYFVLFFCNYRCILKLIAFKNNHLPPFIYKHLIRDLHTPISLFPIIHFRSLYPNRYKTSCNITHIIDYLRPFQVVSVVLAKQFLSSHLFIYNHNSTTNLYPSKKLEIWSFPATRVIITKLLNQLESIQIHDYSPLE